MEVIILISLATILTIVILTCLVLTAFQNELNRNKERMEKWIESRDKELMDLHKRMCQIEGKFNNNTN